MKKKMIETCQEKYHVDWVNQSEDIQNIKNDNKDHRMFKDVKEFYEELKNDPEIEKGICYLCEKHGVSIMTFSRKCKKLDLDMSVFPVVSGFSAAELKFKEDIEKNFGISSSSSNRKILNGKEIDIWIPDHNLGIEYCGLYWHSVDHCKVDRRHLEKYELSKKAGINLLQFFSNEVEDKNDIVMSMIGSRLGKGQRIFARKCQIKEISSREHSEFCERNHLQGSAGASVRIGLFYKTALVSVMSFGKSRFDKTHEWEMIRYCSLLGFNIVGGASKMWKYFLKTYDPESVVTYADARISRGKLYNDLGFDFKHHSGVNYWYTKDCKQIWSRVKFQKHKLKYVLEHFDSSITEKENTTANGYRIIYDAGNLVFTWNKNSVIGS